ncbi:MAG: hypothetical protein AB7G87_02390 [Clostridia bacterium]
MQFQQFLNKYIPIKDIESDLDEIERYLEDKSKDVEQGINKISIKKPNLKKTEGKSKVDSEWVLKTASKNLKIALRRWSRHM